MKKHFFKRILALTLSLGMLFGAMTACTDTPDSSSGSSPNSSSPNSSSPNSSNPDGSSSSSGLTPPEETVADVFIPREYDGDISTAQELIDKLTQSGTYKLTADIVLSDTAASVPADVEVVLDMNGHAITKPVACALMSLGSLTIIGEGTIANTQASTDQNGGGLIQVRNGGNLLIDTDGLTAESTFGCLYVVNAGEVTINGGTYVNKGTYYTVYCGGYGLIHLNGGTFGSPTVNGGRYTIAGYGWANAENKQPIINLNGGTYFPSKLSKDDTFIYDFDKQYPSQINVNGGTFAFSDMNTESIKNRLSSIANLYGMKLEYDFDTDYFKLAMGRQDFADRIFEAQDGEVIGLSEGTFELDEELFGDEFTFMGTGDKTVIDFSELFDAQGAKITFKHLKIQGSSEELKDGFAIANADEVLFEDCTIDGAFTHEFSGKVTYKNCTFTGSYFVTTGMATDVTFEDCVFDKADSRALYIYATNDAPISVTLKNCAFNADAKGYDNGSWTSAVIVDTTNVTTEGSTVSLENCVYSGYYNGLVTDRTTGDVHPTIRLDGALGE